LSPRRQSQCLCGRWGSNGSSSHTSTKWIKSQNIWQFIYIRSPSDSTLVQGKSMNILRLFHAPRYIHYHLDNIGTKQRNSPVRWPHLKLTSVTFTFSTFYRKDCFLMLSAGRRTVEDITDTGTTSEAFHFWTKSNVHVFSLPIIDEGANKPQETEKQRLAPK